MSSALSGSRAWAPRRAAGAGLARGTTDQGAALAALQAQRRHLPEPLLRFVRLSRSIER